MLYSPPAGQVGNFLLAKKGFRSSRVGVSVSVFLFSRAHWALALSIWRRLLMQAFCCEVSRALTKLGMATADRMPMGTTAETASSLAGCWLPLPTVSQPSSVLAATV